MCFIILHHVAVHGNWGNGNVFFPEELTFNAIFLQSILPLGKIGVNLFVMISGFFLIDLNKNTWPKVVKIWSQLLFYSITISIFFLITDGQNLSSKEIFNMLTPVTSNIWWFASTYCLMLLLSPFINRALNACDEKDHLKLAIGLVILWSVLPSLANISFELSNIGWFLTVYIIAAYIKRYPYRFKHSVSQYVMASIVIFAMLIAIAYCIDVTGYTSTFWNITNYVNHNNMQNSLFSISISTLIFLAFTKTSLRHNRAINVVAGSTFGIYLIHDHASVRDHIYSDVFDCFGHTYDPMLPLYVIFISIVIFLVCMTIELIRQSFMDKILLKKLPNVVDGIQTKVNLYLDNKLKKDSD